MTLDEMKPFARGVARILDSCFEFLFGAMGGSIHTENLEVSADELGLAIDVWNTVAPIGLAICLLYFLIDINRIMLMEGNNFTMKSLGNPLLKFGCGLAFIQYGSNIMTDLINFGNALVHWSSEDLTDTIDTGTFYDSMHEIVNEWGFFTIVIMLLAGFAMWIVTLIVGLVIDFKMLILKYEIIFRVAFAPIAMGDVFEGKQSHALRYCKKLLACFTYGAGMVFVCKLGASIMLTSIVANHTELSGTIGTDSVGTAIGSWVATQGEALTVELVKLVGGLLLVPITEIGAFSLIKQASNDVWGC